MTTEEKFIKQIEMEFATARRALATGNDGMARVCARRAAGQALTWFLTRYPRPNWGADALRQLAAMKDDESFPPEVRDAATRLTTKISDRFSYPFTTRPLEDVQIIVDYVRTCVE